MFFSMVLQVATLPYENDTVTYMASDNGNDALGVRASLAVGGFSAEEISKGISAY